jgi:hypothetical protein
VHAPISDYTCLLTVMSLIYNIYSHVCRFRDPFPHLHQHMQDARGQWVYEAYLSDDGARAIRYSPFFANSGFYYLRSTESTRSFSYAVMLGFDILHATGSHQNVFTFRLLENMELFPVARKKFLNLLEFPSGVKFHHDKQFMQKIVRKEAHPYIFHMCWTGKKEVIGQSDGCIGWLI